MKQQGNDLKQQAEPKALRVVPQVVQPTPIGDLEFLATEELADEVVGEERYGGPIFRSREEVAT